MSLCSCSNNVSKDTEVYCKVCLRYDFVNKLLLSTVQKLKVILQTCKQQRWQHELFKPTSLTI